MEKARAIDNPVMETASLSGFPTRNSKYEIIFSEQFPDFFLPSSGPVVVSVPEKISNQ